MKAFKRVRKNETYPPFRVPSEALHYLGILHIVLGLLLLCIGVGLQLTKVSFSEKLVGYTAGILYIATGLFALGVESEDYFRTASPFACFSTLSSIAAICLFTLNKSAADKELDEKVYDKASFIAIMSLSTAVMILAISGIILCHISILLCFKLSSYLLCYGCREQYNMTTTSTQMQEFQEKVTQTDELEFMEISSESMDPTIYFLHRDPNDPEFLNQSLNDPRFLAHSSNDPQFLDQFSIENEIEQREILGSPLLERPSSSLRERPSSPVQERPMSPVQERPGYPSYKRPSSPMQERPVSPSWEIYYSPSMETLSPYKKEYSPPERPSSPFRDNSLLSESFNKEVEWNKENVFRSPTPSNELQIMEKYSPTSAEYGKDRESFTPTDYSSFANKLKRSPKEQGSLDSSLADSTFTPVPEVVVYSLCDSDHQIK